MSLSVRVVNKVRPVSGDIEGKISRAVRTAAFSIEGYAKGNVPPRVDTGNMMNSINANGHGLSYRVDSPAEYSIYHEFGTRYMSAHPFMVPALERVKPMFENDLRRIA